MDVVEAERVAKQLNLAILALTRIIDAGGGADLRGIADEALRQIEASKPSEPTAKPAEPLSEEALKAIFAASIPLTVPDTDAMRRVLHHVADECREGAISNDELRGMLPHTSKEATELLAASEALRQLAAQIATALTPAEVDVDGRVDAKGVRFIGKATRQPNGTWRCLADVGGCLCIVEAVLTFTPENPL